MGLDMYLYSSKKSIEEILALDEDSQYDDLRNNRIGYWRKANHIHKWFVDNVQGGVDECQVSMVTRKHLQALLNLCVKVIDKPEKAPELLPTGSGFFFGSTEYDDGYFNDCMDTIKICACAIESDAVSFFYHSSW